MCSFAKCVAGVVLVFGASIQGVQGVTLAWDPSPDATVVGYKVHYGGARGVYTSTRDVGKVTSASITGLVEGATYYFAATAYNAVGLESGFSNEVGYTVPISTGPPTPTVTLTSPGNGASYTAPATINLAANVAANGQTITKVQFFRGGTLLHEDATAPYSFTWNNVSAGSYSLTARAVYGSGSSVSSAPVSVVVGAAASGVATLWPATAAPVRADYGPDHAGEYGVKFRADVDGIVTGIRFYKSQANTGTHVGNLWTSSGTRLATATFTGESASGWQQVQFATPVAISANTLYVASYHAKSGHYAADVNYFATSGVDRGPLHAPANGAVNGNGVYRYNASSVFPDLTWRSANFWVDVMFQAATATATAVTLTSPGTVASVPVGMTMEGLPAPWETAEIGSLSATGSASVADGIYTVKGAGNIRGSADAFRFVYQRLSGDGEIKVRLRSLQNTGSDARLGIMIRESLTTGSKHAFMGVSPDGTFRWQRRNATSGSTSSTTSITGSPPDIWLRLVRSGNMLHGDLSTDGVNWSRVNSSGITMATNIYIGLAVASGSSSTLNTVTFANVRVIP
jgi:hypothetical protein